LRATLFADLAEPLPKHTTENAKAYGLYLRGRHAWNKRTQEGTAEAFACFKPAIAEDPKFALAFTGLSDAYALHVDYRSVPVHEGLSRAKDYARKALALDPAVAEAHASLAWALFIYDWAWDEAAHTFRRAIELDPRYASAHQWYAMLLASQGNIQEALIEAHTSQELDPASVSARRNLAFVYYYARRYDQTRYHLARALAMNPTAEETYRVLGLALAVEGDYAEAERVLREALDMPGSGTYTIATLGYALARAGQRKEAEELLAGLEARARRDYVSPVAFATIHIGLGSHDRALDAAERAFEERRGWLAYLNVNPIFDPLRGEPRFRALVGRMGLA